MVKSKVKIVVAMSGGVDSSVAAALLKEKGFKVKGVFLKLFDSDSFKESEKRAKKIAGILGIPFFVLDLRKEFKKKIIDYFIKELQQGKTPNPCVLCNKEIKFGILLKKLRELKINFDFIATGHYIKKRKVQSAKLKATAQNSKLIYKLLIAKDKNKDQSYFLWMLDQKQLKHILFPIGNYKKEEVKNLARKFKLPVFSSESQEICFIGKDLDNFLRNNFKIKKGDIINTKGKIVGEHQGLWFYTIGQRKGIGIGGGPASAEATAGKPYYVLDKNLKKNLLVVTKNEKDLYKKELKVKKINWISGKEPRLPIKVKAKIRYRHKSAIAIIIPTHQCVGMKKNKVRVVFSKPQRAITQGQSVVFYQGQQLLGGGIIES
ncbi:tRNA 2-thiouridine(34) synthase MnmA [Candidatus Parcubacteria bacterium]|nr:tRNA 2-thiouridine(34) synthase MnmA [Candidatus Parcubacteria bacterium]